MLLSELTKGLGTADPVVGGKFLGLQLTGKGQANTATYGPLAIFFIP